MDAEAREALELPALLERLASACATEPGATLARALEPSGDEGVVRGRQQLTTEAVGLLDAGTEPELHGISDVRPAAARAVRDGVLDAAELRAVATSVRVALVARERLAGEPPGLAELARAIDPLLAPLADRLDAAVEEDGSDLRDSASPLLHRLRSEVARGAARLRAELERVARQSSVREALQESFLAERGGRPVLAVKASGRAKVPGIVHDASSTGQTLFVEPFAVVELGNRLRRSGRRVTRRGAADPARAVRRRGGGRLGPRCTGRRRCAASTWPSRAGRSRGATAARRVEIADDVSLLGARHPLLDPAAAVPIDLDLGELRGARDQRPERGRQDGRPEDARPCRAPPPVRRAAARRAGDAARVRRRARRHRRPPVDRDEPLDLLRPRSDARRDPRLGDRAVARAARRGRGRNRSGGGLGARAGPRRARSSTRRASPWSRRTTPS